MQKKIIALAVAGLVSGAAFAQSNVTIYGIADIGYINQNAGSAGKGSGIVSGGLSTSRIGFRGTEDLGNGLSAIFQLEYNLYMDTNATIGGGGGITGGTSNGARTQILGLTSKNWGTVVGGFMNSPGMNASVKYDPFGYSMFSPLRNLQDGATVNGAQGVGVFNTHTINGNARVQNAVAYVSPSFGGLTLTGAYVFGGISGDFANRDARDQERTWGLQAEYANGPLSATFVYHDTNNIGNPLKAAASAEVDEWMIAASYDFGMAKVFGTYQVSDFDTGVAGVRNEKDKAWQLGVNVPVTAVGSVQFSYGRASDDATGGNADSTSWGLQYQHAMSKRTTAYAGYSRVSNDRLTNLGNVMGATNPDNGDNSRIWGAGLRHSF